MKQVSAFAFKRPTTAWLLITEDELHRLAGLEAWTFKLFGLLVMFSDFKTGHGRTGYGELIHGLTPDQPERGPRLWVPTRDDVKTAIRRFEGLGLVAVDKTASEKRKAIFFHLPPRTREATSARKLPRQLPPTAVEVKKAKLHPTTDPGESEKNSYPLPPAEPELSTVPPAQAREKLRRISQQIAARGTP
jgi:hypothetical protein